MFGTYESGSSPYQNASPAAASIDLGQTDTKQYSRFLNAGDEAVGKSHIIGFDEAAAVPYLVRLLSIWVKGEGNVEGKFQEKREI